MLDPETSPSGAQHPKWLPRFSRSHICDVVALNIEKDDILHATAVQSDTFFWNYGTLMNRMNISFNGYEPMKHMKSCLHSQRGSSRIYL